MPEPEKGLELNISLVKQLTGGDTFTGRFLNENPVEFRPECKFFINTNHLPRTSDDTVFSSGRVKLIPFDRHFTPEEQDTGLKRLFRKKENMSGILNWMVDGYRLLLEVGLDVPARVADAIAAYRQEADIIGTFLDEYTVEKVGAMSHATLRCIELCDMGAWKCENRLSLAGTSDTALNKHLETRPFIKELVFCLDNDEPGQEASENLIKKYTGKGYSAKVELPMGKDWNDDLTVMVRQIQKEKARIRARSQDICH
jgi:phage/plasmid-associated DNA primase